MMFRFKRVPELVSWFFFLVALGSSIHPQSNPDSNAERLLLESSFSRLPIYFIENQGLYPDPVKFFVQGTDKTLFFTKDGITIRLKGKNRGWVVKLDFVEANPDTMPRGEDQQQAVFSYFRGPEKDWKAGLRTYGKVVYEAVWPGIDLVYKGKGSRLKYEFVVQPGADAGTIRLRYRGATRLEVTDSDALRIQTPAGCFEDEGSIAFQEIGGERVAVEMAFALNDESEEGGRSFGFRVGGYDRTRPLILDPAVLLYCGYIGGANQDSGHDVAVDASGNAYVTGQTDSDEKTFPVKSGPDPTYNTGYDAFVAKVNARGTGLVYCGYIGGAGSDDGRGIAVDASGNAYVTGITTSDQQTFPVMGGPDLTFNGYQDAFVAKVNTQGTGLVYCGYIGGGIMDRGEDIAVDPAGNAYVTGTTDSTEQTFPVTVGPDLTFNGINDAFVAKVNASGQALAFCGYIGGSSMDTAEAISVDLSGNAYVAGATSSPQVSFPVRTGPTLTFSGYSDAFVAKVNARGTGLVYCGYLGGTDIDWGHGIDVDPAGNAFVTGRTTSPASSFPLRVGPGSQQRGGNEVFVAKVSGTGSLAYCGYIAGAGEDWGMAVAVDRSGNAHVGGWTMSTETTFPVKLGPGLKHLGGPAMLPMDAFVAKVNSAGTGLVYCGYVGGTGYEEARGVAVDSAGSVYLVGFTASDPMSFPAAVGPDLTFNGGRYDAFVARIALLDRLSGSGTPRIGGTITLNLAAVEVRGLPYQAGTSLGTGPIPIDTRKLNLSPDALLASTVGGFLPSLFVGFRGVIDNQGNATARINIPNLTILIGTHLHTAFVTLDPTAPSGIKSISNTFSFSILK